MTKIGKYEYRINNNNVLVLYNNEWKDVPKNYEKYLLLYNIIGAHDFNLKLSRIITSPSKPKSSSFFDILTSGFKNNSGNGFYSSSNALQMKDFTTSAMKKALGPENYEDIKLILTDPNLSFSDKMNMFKDGFERKFDKSYEGNDLTEKKRFDYGTAFNKLRSDINNSITADVINPAFADSSYNISNDTTFWNKVDPYEKRVRLYSVPRSINLKGTKLGARNRGNRSSFLARDVIGTYKPIYTYEDGVKGGYFTPYDSEGHINEFLGFDPEGNFKIGTFDKFGPGDTMSKVYYGFLHSVNRDANGNLVLVLAAKDSRRLSPTYTGRGEPIVGKEPGPYESSAFLLMTPKKSELHKYPDRGLNLYNNVIGGGYILNIDDEYRLVRGSINNVIDEIEAMQKNHRGKDVKLYLIDNGSYNRGLMTLDNNYTALDLIFYDSQNGEAGHFFYLKPEGYPVKKLGGKIKIK